MQQAKQVISIAPYASGNMLSFADIILPGSGFGETSGTYVNGEGRWQSFRAAAKNYGNARPAWKILRVLGNKLGIQGFDYVSSADVRDELEIACDAVPAVNNDFEVSGIYTGQDDVAPGKFQRIGDVAAFCGDSLVRRASALQKSAPEQAMVWLNNHSIETLKLGDALAAVEDGNQLLVNVRQGDEAIEMPLKVDDSIPDGCALLMAGTQASALLGPAFGELEIEVVA
jgi:NADH-quinone oxidoreductase subunit G